MRRRRAFLAAVGSIGATTLTGCVTSLTPKDDIADTDGDGVINTEDYAPWDANVQAKSDVGRSVPDGDGSESGGDSGDSTTDGSDSDDGETDEPGGEGGETPERTPTSQPAAFVDAFEDGTFEGVWEFLPGNRPDDDTVEERDGVLYHHSPHTYNNGAGLRTRQSFEPTGTMRLRSTIRSLERDYWGYGIMLRFEDGGGIQLKEQRWGRDDAFQLKFLRPDADNAVTRVAGLGHPSDPTGYAFTVDFDAEVVRSVVRGAESLDRTVSFPDSNFQPGPARIRIGLGRGHEIEYHSVALEAL